MIQHYHFILLDDNSNTMIDDDDKLNDWFVEQTYNTLLQWSSSSISWNKTMTMSIPDDDDDDDDDKRY